MCGCGLPRGPEAAATIEGMTRGGDKLVRPLYLLVMTATIEPAANAGVRRADPAERLEDYKAALRYWLGYEHRVAERILVLENSGADLSQLRAIAEGENRLGKAVEILSVPGNVIPEGRNYGYTEMELLDEGLLRSRLRKETTHLIKVTGRLRFPALGRAVDLLEGRGDGLELMIDCRKLGFPRRGHDCAVQMFACSHGFYDRVLRGSRELMNRTDLRLLEQLMFRQVIGHRGEPGVWLRFPCNVEPEGYSGFKARSYGGPRTAVVRWMRAALRVVAPWYWF